jgi:hypothetical protein
LAENIKHSADEEEEEAAAEGSLAVERKAIERRSRREKRGGELRRLGTNTCYLTREREREHELLRL